MTWLDIFGYIGSVLVAISLMMSNIKRLRWINLFGAGIFSAYGFLIDALPVFMLNGWIFLVDIYYLIRLYRFQDDFDLVKLNSVRTPLFELLLQRYGDDLHKFFPNATQDHLDHAVAMLIFRNMKPVGLFAYKRDPEDPTQAEVLIDYVIPEARDLKTAKYLFDRHSSQLKEEHIRKLHVTEQHAGHANYLRKVGFVAKDDAYWFDFH